MKIWVFQTGEPLPIDGDDVRPMRAINVVNMLVSRKHDVTLWSARFYHQQKQHRTGPASIVLNSKLRVNLLDSPGYGRNIGLARLWDHFKLALELKSELKRIEDKDFPSAIFLGYPPIEAAFVMAKWAKEKNIPVILDVKDQWPDVLINHFSGAMNLIAKLAFSPYTYLAKKTFKNVDGITAMSTPFLDWSVEYANRKRQTQDLVVPLTPPVDSISKENQIKANQWFVDLNTGDSKLILFVGTFSQAFNFDAVIEAAAKAEAENLKVQFILCGDGPFKEYIHDKTKHLSTVKMPGWLGRAQVMALSNTAIAMLAPYNNTEDFIKSIPNKVIDSMLLGMPLLSSLEGEVKSVISKHNIGFSYYTADQLLEQVKELAVDEKMQRQLSENAYATYENEYSYERVYSGLCKHIEKIAM